MTAAVREFTAGQAMFTRHDAHTRHHLDGFRDRLDCEKPNGASNLALLAAACRVERMHRHPLAAELRLIVEHEIEWRRVTRPEFSDWWTATIAGGAR